MRPCGGFEQFSKIPCSAGQMIDSPDALELCGLGDLGFSGLPYTYDNRQSGRANVKVRLDRVAENKQWHDMFLEADVKNLVVFCSAASLDRLGSGSGTSLVSNLDVVPRDAAMVFTVVVGFSMCLHDHRGLVR